MVLYLQKVGSNKTLFLHWTLQGHSMAFLSEGRCSLRLILHTILLFEKHSGKVFVGQRLRLCGQVSGSWSSVHPICYCPVLSFGIGCALPMKWTRYQRDLSASFPPSENGNKLTDVENEDVKHTYAQNWHAFKCINECVYVYKVDRYLSKTCWKETCFHVFT